MRKPEIKLGMKWEELPTVALGEMLEELDWFQGRGAIKIGQTKADWEVDSRTHPMHVPYVPSLQLSVSYRKKEIKVNIAWTQRRSGKGTTSQQFFEITCLDSYKPKRIQTYKGAIRVIETEITNALPKIDEEVEHENEMERRRKRFDKKVNRLSEMLNGADLRNGRLTNQVRYPISKDYSVRFALNGNEDEAIYGECFSIEGVFDAEEIKNIISVIASSPSAVASRLKEG